MATATGYSPTFGLSYATIGGRPGEGNLARENRKDKVKQELALTLNGAAAGQAALASEKRVAADVAGFSNNHGLVSIETRTLVDRVTTGGDKTNQDEILDRDITNAYVADLSGNTEMRASD